MPTIAELQTLIRRGSAPAIDAAFNTGCAPGCSVLTCSCTVPGDYWSSTNAGGPQDAWLVDFSFGVDSTSSATLPFSVRAVRGGS